MRSSSLSGTLIAPASSRAILTLLYQFNCFVACVGDMPAFSRQLRSTAPSSSRYAATAAEPIGTPLTHPRAPHPARRRDPHTQPHPIEGQYLVAYQLQTPLD